MGQKGHMNSGVPSTRACSLTKNSAFFQPAYPYWELTATYHTHLLRTDYGEVIKLERFERSGFENVLIHAGWKKAEFLYLRVCSRSIGPPEYICPTSFVR